MANPEHLAILKRGIEAWCHWRSEHPEVRPDLREAHLIKSDLAGVDFRDTDLTEAWLGYADLSGAKLRRAKLQGAKLLGTKLSNAHAAGADFSGAILNEADLFRVDLLGAVLEHASIRGANLREAKLFGARLMFSDLSDSDLEEADLTDAKLFRVKACNADFASAHLDNADLSEGDFERASLYRAILVNATLSGTLCFQSDLTEADLSGAHLDGTNLRYANLVEAKVEAAKFRGCYVYGSAVWRLNGKPEIQSDLIITSHNEPKVTVDDLEVAQFVYLLLDNEKLRDVIDTIGRKGVLILGRFTPERKQVLETLRNSLRDEGFVPMMFDFERPTQRDFTETIKTLAGLCRFIVADITNPRSSPLELQAIMPDYMIPFVPIIAEEEEPFAMFRDLKQKYGEWVLDPVSYPSIQILTAVIKPAIIQRALDKSDELVHKKSEEIRIRRAADYLKK